MNEENEAAEGGAMPRVPLSDEILRYRQEAFERGNSFVLSPDEGRSLLAEVVVARRLLRALANAARRLEAASNPLMGARAYIDPQAVYRPIESFFGAS